MTRPSAHFSNCGQHLAVLVTNSRLLIIPFFERVIDGRVKDIHDIMVDVQLNAPTRSIYLAYEDNRIGVVTVCNLFFVLLDGGTDNTLAHRPLDYSSSTPNSRTHTIFLPPRKLKFKG